jgi:type IX secretion system PorP/SprF family membrane protein
VISAQKETSWSPSLKAGVFFHTERFYAGLSITDLLGIDKDINYDPERHYFFNVGYVADISHNVKVKPSIMLKENFDGPTNADFNLFFLFGERIWIGGGYRTAMNLFKNDFEAKGLSSKDAVVAIAELFVTKQLRLGYSHDFSLSRNLNDLRTHEISVGYSFLNKEETKMVTPRYF